MPGLRSLVARRRCSLPSAQLSSDSILCTYQSLPGPISSRKGHSLDEIHPSENLGLDKSGKDDKSIWALQNLFSVKEEPVSSTYDEKHFCPNNMPTMSEIDLNGSEKENDHSVAQCRSDFFDSLDVSLKQEIKSESLPHEENGIENESVELSKNVSPERIVIKMKLMHGSSLSDVTNISPDSSSDSNESAKSEFLYDRNCTQNTHWTIDSILNQPFVENMYSDCNNSNSSNIYMENLQILNTEANSKENHKHFEYSNENEVSSIPVLYENTAKENETSGQTSNMIFQEKSIVEHEKCEKLDSPLNGEMKSIENVRRSSDRSDISEDSICSEASNGSSLSSSDSSVKSCSIVIKRLENSDTYSCFRSPKSKRKKHLESEFTKTVYFNGKSSLPVLYIQKRMLYDTEENIIPCSVTLCDIFSNYPFKKENCPNCCQFYNLESDMLIDICCNTLTLQCLTCKWLVVRSLKLKEIDLNASS